MSHSPRRAVAVATSALLALMLLGPGVASAATPGWEYLDVAYLPTTVSPGASAGYTFRIHNGGKSNISQLYLTDSINAAPTYFDNSRGTTCQLSPTLYCAFGALNAGDSIVVTVAYATPTSGSSFPVTFQLNSTGASFSDKGKNSHGDTLSLDLSTALNGGKNFAGGFSLDLTTIQNDQNLGPKNVQAGKVTPPAANIPVTIEDGLADTTFSCTAVAGACADRFGEWTRLNVHDGETFAGGVKVVVTILGNKVPSYATISTIGLIHVPSLPDGSLGTPYTITTACSASTLPAVVGGDECITVTKVGNNFQITAWLHSNGGLRLF